MNIGDIGMFVYSPMFIYQPKYKPTFNSIALRQGANLDMVPIIQQK